MSRLDEIKKRDAELVDYANLVPDRRYLLSMVDALQAELAAAQARSYRRGLRVAQLEAALQPFLLKPPQTHQIDILSRPQPVWWDCICGISNSLDTCGNCHRSRLD